MNLSSFQIVSDIILPLRDIKSFSHAKELLKDVECQNIDIQSDLEFVYEQENLDDMKERAEEMFYFYDELKEAFFELYKAA